MNTSNVVKALTPNPVIIDKFLSIMPEEMKTEMRKAKFNVVDFGKFIVNVSVKDHGMTVADAWDMVFGDGSYALLKNEIYNTLETEFHN